MLFEVMLPPSDDGQRIGHTVVVEATNWLVALREGVAELGLDPRIERRGQCEIRSDQSVTVTDRKRGTVVHLRLIARLPDERWAEVEPVERLRPPDRPNQVVARCSTEELDQVVADVLARQDVDVAVDVIDLLEQDLAAMDALHGDVDRASNLALEVALRHVPCRTGWVMFVEGDALVVQAARGSRAAVALDRRHPSSRGLSGQCVATGLATLSSAAEGPLMSDDLAHAIGLTPSSAACVPVRAGGEVRGVLQLLDRSTGAFSGPDLALLGEVADHLGRFLEG
ncbi:MAG: hypothetical protein AMXMBFR64_41160 [Myxococcales bacterium]